MKKNISILLIVSMLLCALPVSAISFNDIEDSEHSLAITQLSNMGILSGYEDGSFRADDVMTRGEFATVLVRIFGFDEKELTYSNNYFADVPEEHFAKNSIMYCTDMKIMQGYEDGLFRPDQPVSYTEAVKLVVCALGYYVVAENSGGYPSGYLQEAKNLTILNGLGKKVTDKITRGEIARLIYNALNVRILEETSFGDSSNLETTGETILTKYLKMDIVKGVLVANGYTKIEFVADTYEDQIVIGDMLINKNGCYNEELLGRYVEAIYTKEDAKLVTVAASDSKNETMVLSKESIQKTGEGKIYYTEDGKDREINISGTRKIVYNGLFDFDYDLAELEDLKDGSVTFIDNDGDNKFDVLFVNEWDTYIVMSQIPSSGIVRDIKDATKILPLDDFETVVIRDMEGNLVDLENIGEVLILNVIETGSYVECVVVNNPVQGKITEVGVDDIGRFYVINGKNMYLSDRYMDSEFSALNVGDFVTVYTNNMGNIAYAEKGSEGNYNIGLLMDLKKVPSGPDYDLYIKVYDKNDKVTSYKIADKISINETRYTAETDESLIRTALTYKNSLGVSDRGVSQMVVYRLDDEKNVKEIHTADSNLSDSAKLYKFTPSGGLYYGTATYSFGGVVNVDDDTWILSVPDGDLKDKEAEDFTIYSKSEFVTDSYMVEFYNTTKNQPVANVVTILGTTVPPSYSYDSALSVITDVVQAVDENGDLGTKIKYFSSGSEHEAFLSEMYVKSEMLKKGEIVRLAFDRYDKIKSAAKYFDSLSRSWISSSLYNGTSASNYYSATSRIMAAYVTDVRDGYVRTGYKKEIPSEAELVLQECTKVTADIGVYVVETSGTSVIIRKGDIGDIEILDSVVIRNRGGLTREIYVVKQDI